MNCTTCGAELPTDVASCGICGAPRSLSSSSGRASSATSGSSDSSYLRSAASSASPPNYATWGSRAVGWIVDAAIFLIAYIVVLIIAAISPFLGVIALIGMVAFALWYQIFFAGGALGQTPGMMLAGVKLVNADTSSPVGYGRTFGRLLIASAISSFTFGIVGVIDYLFPLWDSRSQTLHDKGVGTVVVRVDRLGFADVWPTCVAYIQKARNR